MELALAHLQEHAAQYGVVAAIVVPFLYFTRRWTWGPIQWALELIVYFGIFHTIMHYVVMLTDWFQFESQMKMLVDQKVRMGYVTPLEAPWQMEAYNPAWIFYVEIAAIVLIIAMMFRYRPMKTQKPLPKREALRKLWDEYLAAFEEVISATSLDHAPWYIVPANRKWYRDLAVAETVVAALEDMKLKCPPAPKDVDFDKLKIT